MLSLPKHLYHAARVKDPNEVHKMLRKLSMTFNSTPGCLPDCYNRPKFSPRISTMPITMSIK
jgi:hypothetical protein